MFGGLNARRHVGLEFETVATRPTIAAAMKAEERERIRREKKREELVFRLTWNATRIVCDLA
jgi:hypothetical protein